MQLFLRPNLARSRFFHGLAVAGALAVCAVVLALAPVSGWQVAGWMAVILLAEAGTSLVNERMAAAPPGPGRTGRWAGIKTATSTVQGLAWAAGVAFLHVPGEPVTVLAPAWAILTVTVGVIYACAAWPPALQGMAVAANLPAALMLFALGGGVEVAVAICMVVSLVFALVIGSLAVRNVGDLIRARLDLADLLARQTALTDRLAVLNADRTRIFSAASHDLRQPLQALGFYATLLAETPSAEVIARLAACVEALDRQFNAIIGVAATDAAIARAHAPGLDHATIVDDPAHRLVHAARRQDREPAFSLDQPLVFNQCGNGRAGHFNLDEPIAVEIQRHIAARCQGSIAGDGAFIGNARCDQCHHTAAQLAAIDDDAVAARKFMATVEKIAIPDVQRAGDEGARLHRAFLANHNAIGIDQQHLPVRHQRAEDF